MMNVPLGEQGQVRFTNLIEERMGFEISWTLPIANKVIWDGAWGLRHRSSNRTRNLKPHYCDQRHFPSKKSKTQIGPQSRTQNRRALWSVGERQERIWYDRCRKPASVTIGYAMLMRPNEVETVFVCLMLLFFTINRVSDRSPAGPLLLCRQPIKKIISFHFPRFFPGSHPLTKNPEYLSYGIDCIWYWVQLFPLGFAIQFLRKPLTWSFFQGRRRLCISSHLIRVQKATKPA